VDNLIKSGMFQIGSEIIREVTRRYIIKNNYNGMIPHIIGPFTAEEIEKLNNIIFDSSIPPEIVIEEIKEELKTLKLVQFCGDYKG
jgi:hypothetical protein